MPQPHHKLSVHFTHTRSPLHTMYTCWVRVRRLSAPSPQAQEIQCLWKSELGTAGVCVAQSPLCRAQELAAVGRHMPRATTCLEGHLGPGVKGSAGNPGNGTAASLVFTARLPLGPPKAIKVFVVWPGWASPRIKWLLGRE